MADAASYSGDEYTDDEEDGEELDPRVQVSLHLAQLSIGAIVNFYNAVSLQCLATA